jgi:hypothetical protein
VISVSAMKTTLTSIAQCATRSITIERVRFHRYRALAIVAVPKET